MNRKLSGKRPSQSSDIYVSGRNKRVYDRLLGQGEASQGEACVGSLTYGRQHYSNREQSSVHSRKQSVHERTFDIFVLFSLHDPVGSGRGEPILNLHQRSVWLRSAPHAVARGTLLPGAVPMSASKLETRKRQTSLERRVSRW